MVAAYLWRGWGSFGGDALCVCVGGVSYVCVVVGVGVQCVGVGVGVGVGGWGAVCEWVGRVQYVGGRALQVQAATPTPFETPASTTEACVCSMEGEGREVSVLCVLPAVACCYLCPLSVPALSTPPSTCTKLQAPWRVWFFGAATTTAPLPLSLVV